MWKGLQIPATLGSDPKLDGTSLCDFKGFGGMAEVPVCGTRRPPPGRRVPGRSGSAGELWGSLKAGAGRGGLGREGAAAAARAGLGLLWHRGALSAAQLRPRLDRLGSARPAQPSLASPGPPRASAAGATLEPPAPQRRRAASWRGGRRPPGCGGERGRRAGGGSTRLGSAGTACPPCGRWAPPLRSSVGGFLLTPFTTTVRIGLSFSPFVPRCPGGAGRCPPGRSGRAPTPRDAPAPAPFARLFGK